MVHFNSNKMCVIDCETTGLIAGYHDLIQICVLLLKSDLTPDTSRVPFYTLLKQKRPQNVDPKAMKVNKINLKDVEEKGLDPWHAAELFEEWYKKLNMPTDKKIIPLAHNWAFDHSFIVDWLQPGYYNLMIHMDARDTRRVAAYLNDRADFHNERYPFSRYGLSNMASALGFEATGLYHDALYDCMMTAKIYKNLCERGLL